MPTLLICWPEANAKHNGTTLATAALSLDKSQFYLPATIRTFGILFAAFWRPLAVLGLLSRLPASR